MIAKIVLLFLVFMGVLAMFGKLTLPGQRHLKNRRCPKCGRFRIGKRCSCEKGS